MSPARLLAIIADQADATASSLVSRIGPATTLEQAATFAAVASEWQAFAGRLRTLDVYDDDDDDD